MRLIDADALEKDYRSQFESVYKNIRDTVNPSDFYIERKAAYDKELVRLEMEAFFKYLQGRPTVDAEPVRHAFWEADVWSATERRVIETVPLTEENQLKYAFRKPFDKYLINERCSACKEDPLANFNEEYEFSECCPNCGAKMDAEEVRM